MSDPQVVADTACQTGEGPIWHAARKLLYWLDIPTGRLFQYDPAGGRYALALKDDDPIGAVTVEADGALLLFQAAGRVRRWAGEALTTLVDELPGHGTHRFNDAVADPEGRVFAGMMAPGHGDCDVLYRLDRDRSATRILGGVGRTNGLGFSPDGGYLYYTDTHRREIYRFDYDRATGRLSGQEVLVRTPDDAGSPDGLAVDAEGCLWSAMWGGGCVLRFRPDGCEDGRIDLPTPRVTSVAFGGAGLDTLFVTTAGGDRKDQFGEHAGALFRIDPGVCGRPEFLSRLGA
jgi:D-xylonolactonase